MLESLNRHPVRIVTCVFSVVVLATVFFLILRPSITNANPSPVEYPVRGVDISAHNGEINFTELAESTDFIMMKVTEGATWTDRNFNKNYDSARKAGLKVGAYHYFRFDRPGISQAINVYNALWNRPIDLPLAIDVEDSGNPSDIPSETVVARIREMVDFLEARGMNIMFYTNKKGYKRYVQHEFSIYPLWICSFTTPPVSAKWMFWQFTHSDEIKGISGKVDMNVFNGSKKDFDRIIMTQSWK